MSRQFDVPIQPPGANIMMGQVRPGMIITAYMGSIRITESLIRGVTQNWKLGQGTGVDLVTEDGIRVCEISVNVGVTVVTDTRDGIAWRDN